TRQAGGLGVQKHELLCRESLAYRGPGVMQGGNRGKRALAMLMRQRQVPINHDESLGYALPLEEPGNGLVTTGAGEASCRCTTQALQAFFVRGWWMDGWWCFCGLGGTALRPQERQTLSKLHRNSPPRLRRRRGHSLTCPRSPRLRRRRGRSLTRPRSPRL